MTIEVVATVNLPGLRRGQHALVDPDTPYVATCLRAGYVVAVPNQPQRHAQYEGLDESMRGEG